MAEADRLRLAARQESDYAGFGYAPLLDDDLRAIAAVATDVAGDSLAAINSAATASTQAGIAATQATAAATSRAQADAAVASVTVGSTNSLAYPEQVRNLITATDVVDVFVYDTRLDSDGGAWTERCTGTTWFNETLNTATRGAKRAFPKVALIVARQTSLTIYDALELDGSSVPRMWMVFSSGVGNVLSTSSPERVVSSVFAVNGTIFVSTNGGSGGLFGLNFPSDETIYKTTTVSRSTLNLAQRNTGASAFVSLAGRSGLTNRNCNAVHARVLPGAPLNPVSGLPIPTVAVATAGGVSVIHPTGLVTNITRTGGHTQVVFADDLSLRASQGSGDGVEIGPIPYAGATNGVWRSMFWGVGSIPAPLPSGSSLGGNLVGKLIVQDALGSLLGLELLAYDPGNPSGSMFARTATNYATGWMPGDIRMAALNRGTTGNAVGTANLIVNGTFDTDLSGWTATTIGAGTPASVSAGVAQLPRVDASNRGVIDQSFSTVIGESYVITYDQTTAAAINVNAGNSIGSGLSGVLVTSGVQAGRIFSFVATSTTSWVRFGANTDGTTGGVDNVSIRLGAMDHSAHANGLNVVGTLSRAAVATGADLAAWSGFSASNYLEQPFSTNLDAASGPLAAPVWVNCAAGGATGTILARGTAAGAHWVLDFNGSNQPRFTVSDGTNSATVTGTSALNSGMWAQLVPVVDRALGTVALWVNGLREASASLGSVGSLSNASAILRVGLDLSGTNPCSGSLALLRAALYAPTPAQIERMFRDERALFQTNARAFLGGTSSAVRRLARSQFTRRLAVATANGVSVFDGLQRVEYLSNATHAEALASNDVRAVSMEGGVLVTGTASNAGVRRDAVIGMDRLTANEPSPASPRMFRARGVTTDATPLTIAPRILIAERETVVVTALIVARVYGASDTQRLTYERRATYHRDAGGNVTLAGSVQVVGTDVEVTSTADATLVLDTTAQTVAAQVTGIAATRLVWTVRYQIERSTHETTYEETV